MQSSWLKLTRFIFHFDKNKPRIFIGLILMVHMFTMAFSLEKNAVSTQIPDIEYQRINNQITLHLDSLAIQWERSADGTSITIPNAEKLNSQGQPDIPFYSTTLVLPSDGIRDTTLKVSPAIQISAPVNLRISPTSNPDSISNFVTERSNSCEKIFPEFAIQVGEPFWYRDQHLVSVIFYPIRWDCQSHQFLLEQGSRNHAHLE